MIPFHVLHDKVGKIKPPPEAMLCLDPGETTGWAFFKGLELVASGQWNTSDVGPGAFHIYNQLIALLPSIVVMEDYRVYGWKADAHKWANLHTPKLIGGIELACRMRNIPIMRQMAVEAKTFCNDDKLEGWGMYVKGQRHARDAIRHGAYYLLFGKGTGHAITKG